MRLFTIVIILLAASCSQPQRKAAANPSDTLCEKRHTRSAQSLVERYFYEAGKVKRVDFDDGNNSVIDQTTTYTYVGDEPVEMVTLRGEVVVEKRTITWMDGKRQSETVDELDAKGERGTDGEPDKSVTYLYEGDQLVEIAVASEWSKPLRRLHYYTDGQLSRIDIVQDDVVIAKHNHQYAGERLVGIEVDFGANDQIDEKYRYTYNDAGQITSIAKFRGDDLCHSFEHAYDCRN